MCNGCSLICQPALQNALCIHLLTTNTHAAVMALASIVIIVVVGAVLVVVVFVGITRVVVVVAVV